jgi:hypothetical protein
MAEIDASALTPEAAALLAEQQREWGKYVAVERIFIDGALAFNAGDPVPAQHVDRADAPVNKSQVTGANTKAAVAAKES